MNSRFQETSFIALSHRGNSKEYLENSFEAFKSVVDKGYSFIETDLRKTLDNKIVTFHDKSLKRLFDIDQEIKNLSFKEINTFFKQKNCRLLTLEETLNEFPKIKFNIDLKIKEVVEPATEIVNNQKAFDRVCFASFNSGNTKKVKNKFPQANISMGLKDVALFKLFNITNNFSEILQVPINWKGINILNYNFIKRAMTRKILVHAWTINDENNMRKLISMGINGIITDEPDLLLKVMRDENLSF